jgi:outer membrane translocation and assembly module TamA
VRRVEEAGRALLRERAAVDPGLHARDRVTAVLEDLGDVADLVRPGDRVEGGLRVLVRVQRALVVLLHRLVERVARDVDVEALELLAELGHVLVGGTARGGELALEGGALGVLPLADRVPPVETHAAEDHRQDQQQDEEFSHGASVPPVR